VSFDQEMKTARLWLNCVSGIAFALLLSQQLHANESDPTIREKAIVLQPDAVAALLDTTIGPLIHVSKNIVDCSVVFYNLGADLPKGSSVVLHTDTHRLVIMSQPIRSTL
jgi:hypothetical protein